MPTLHLTPQGAKLRLRAGRLLLEDRDGQPILSAPARKVRRVAVHGNVSLTTPALNFLLKNNGSVYFISQQGKLYGQAASFALPDPKRIVRQLSLSPEEQLEIARAILLAKVRSQSEYLRRSGVALSETALPHWASKLRTAQNLDKLRGFEGAASRAYFELLAGPLSALGFSGRRRRPPTDPVNAALSYGYAILLSLTTTALLVAEVHPEIGVLHTTGRRKPALALDLMEEFRVAVVDAPIVRAFKRGWLNHGDARREGNAVLLNDEGKKKVIEALETRLSFVPAGEKDDYRGLVFRQAERLAAAIVHAKPYSGYFLIRG